MSNRKYYLPGKETTAFIEAFHAERQRVFDSWIDICNRYGGSQVYHTNRLVGLVFDDKAPAGWRHEGGKVYVPKGNSKVTREAYKDFKTSETMPGTHQFALKVKIDSILDGRLVINPSYECYGGQWILSCAATVPEERIPADCTPLKMSDYWAIREAAEAANSDSEVA